MENDDFLSDITTTGLFNLTSPIRGNIENEGDEDWFKISLVAGVTYQFNLEGNEGNEVALTRPIIQGLFDEMGDPVNGIVEVSDAGLSSKITYTPTITADYFVAAAAADSIETGAYQLSVVPLNITILEELQAGGSVAGDITTESALNAFRVTLQAGASYQIDLQGADTDKGTLSDSSITGLFDSNGVFIEGTNDNDSGTGVNAQVIFSPTETADFFIVVGANSTETGSYQLTVNPLLNIQDDSVVLEMLGNIEVGGSVTGEIETAKNQDSFGVLLSKDVSYRIDLEGIETAAGTLTDPFLRGIYDALGQLVEGVSVKDDDGGVGYNARLVFTPATDGYYFINAGAFDTKTGSYRLSVNIDGESVPPDILPDDFSDDINTDGVLEANASISGEIENGSDVDWFRVDITEGKLYQFELEGNATAEGSLYDPLLKGIYTADGVEISGFGDDNSGVGLNAQLSGIAPISTTFYVAVAGHDLGTGSYNLSFTETDAIEPDDYSPNIDTIGALQLNVAPVTAAIETAFDQDWFRVTIVELGDYVINLMGSDSDGGALKDPYLRGFYTDEGILVEGMQTQDDDSGTGLNARFSLTALEVGEYFVAAGAWAEQIGSYSISLSQQLEDDYTDNVNTIGTVSVGASATGIIEEVTDRDWFAVTLDKNSFYRISLNDMSDDGSKLNTFIRGIYDSSGVITANSSNDNLGFGTDSSLLYSPDESGLFYISAGSDEMSTGTYSLSVVLTEAPPPPPVDDDFLDTIESQGVVVPGNSVSGSVELAGDSDWFRVTLEAGVSYRFSLQGFTSESQGALLDPLLQGLYTSDGSKLNNAFDDDAGVGLNALFNYTPRLAGDYFIETQAYDNLTGAYLLSVEENTVVTDDFASSTSTEGGFKVGGSILGNIETGGDVDWIKVSLEADTIYVINLEGSVTGAGTLRDTILKGVYSSSGSLLSDTFNDDGGVQQNSLLLYTPTSSDDYFIASAAFSNTAGTYTLSVEEGLPDDYLSNTNTTGAINVGSSVAGSIENSTDTDWFKVSLTGGTTYQISLISSSGAGALSDAFLEGVFNSSGSLISGTTNDDVSSGVKDSGVNYTPGFDGIYYISAAGFDVNTGDYILSIV